MKGKLTKNNHNNKEKTMNKMSKEGVSTNNQPMSTNKNNEVMSTTNGDVIESESDSENTMSTMNEKWLTIKIEAPNKETIQLEQISSSDTVLSIRQLIAEHPTLVSYTCYHFEVIKKDGTTSALNDFVEFGEYEEILSENNVTLKMVLDPYDFRKVQEHVRRLRETLVNPPIPQVTVVPNVPKSNVKENEQEETSKTDGATNEEAIKKKLENMRKIQESLASMSIPMECRLTNLYENAMSPSLSAENNSKDKDKKKKKQKEDKKSVKTFPKCMKSLVFSGYNPPPGNRKLSGDLCYLEFLTLDNQIYYITAHITGFYVNSSTSKSFNPARDMSYALSHSILDLLCSCSTNFADSYKELLSTAAEISKAGPFSTENMVAVGNSLYKLEWTVPADSSLVKREYDLNRAQEELAGNFGMIDKGVLRDWNEEYQCCRELPNATLKDRVIRSRVMYKVLSEFVDAATQGAIAVIEGNIPPVNPMDAEKAHVFVFNNIFYSLATDSKNAAKETYGEETAFSSANNDLQGVIAYSQADVTGLHTLATVIVDYIGVRVVAQSIIPGILQGDAASKLVYGSIDGGKTVKSDEKMHKLMVEAGKKMHIGERKILPNNENSSSERDDGEKSLKICGAVEAKGILGSDGRMYILDLVRTTPRDAIFYRKTEQETSDIEGLDFKRDDDYIAILRPEILELYSMWKQAKIEKTKKKAEAQSENGKTDSENTKDGNEAETSQEEKSVAEKSKEEVEPKPEIKEEHHKTEEEPILFNPNVFNSNAQLADSEQTKTDEADAIEIAYYLQNVVIPAFVTDIRRGSMLPIDGHILTDTMHSCGINMRYLGRLAVLCARLEENEGIGKYVLELLETEMVARSLKHIFFETVSRCDELRLAPLTMLCRLLNCLLGNVCTNFEPETEENTIKKKGSKSKNKTKGADQTNVFNGDNERHDASLPVYDAIMNESNKWTSQSLWSAIKEDISKKYAYELRLWPAKNGNEKQRTHPLPMLRRVCQKLGLRVLCRDYDFSSLNPFSIDDIVNVVPVTKSSLPKQPLAEAKVLLDRGRVHLTTGSLGEAYELLQESATLLYQVCGAAHEDAALCCSSLAMVLYHAGDYSSALVQQQRALALYAQLMGVDYHDTVFAHINLALFLHALGQVDEAVKHLQRAITLFQLLGGPHLTEISALYAKMGSMIQEVGHISLSLICYRESLQHGDVDRLTAATTFHQMATACAMAGGFREALTYEKKSYGLLKDTLGEDDIRVKECAKYMAKFTEKAVEGAKGRKELDSVAEAERMANEVAKQLLLDAEKEDNSKKNKKTKKQKNTTNLKKK